MFYTDKRFIYMMLIIVVLMNLMGMTQGRLAIITFNSSRSISCNNIS
ncbi:MAG: hypothetical protein HFJ54_05325 [Clostridia bacterium]|nr:hypothetical protein [Clostridia bacterium]